ncbi:hypothetical protein ACHHYP_13499 [Achlya hypogyna]|uniref:DUF4371 domain-containing protein n=1 Tax=Achlya hypogyna TaxID=1202772 RepID=A0A1V9YF68_ACHHY|nr:hypothetical protein ACHHYP_13499 [Achlya hypogyna]
MFTQGGYVGGPNKVLKAQAVKDHGASAGHLKATMFLAEKGALKTYVSEQPFATQPGVYRSYANNQAAMELIVFCSTETMASSVAAIAEAVFYSIMVDESTDVASSKNLIVMARFVDGSGRVRIVVIGLVALGDGMANAIIRAIDRDAACLATT